MVLSSVHDNQLGLIAGFDSVFSAGTNLEWEHYCEFHEPVESKHKLGIYLAEDNNLQCVHRGSIFLLSSYCCDEENDM